jgi:serine/threonine-protein phosphatase 2A regulatory subunit A
LRAQLSDGVFEASFVSLAIRLAESEWFPPKVSACSLFADALKRSSEANKEKLLGLCSLLCKDETPMVRRAAASNLKVCRLYV